MSEPGQLATAREALHLRDVPDASRYEGRLGRRDQIAAILDYRRMEHSLVLLHTEVQSGFEGQGVGSRFAKAVFEDLRHRGLTVVPKCPFILRWLERHPEQQDILAQPLDPPQPPAAGGLEPA